MNIIQKFKEFFTPSKVKELEEKVNQLQRNAIQNVLQPIKTGSDFDIDKKDEKLISKVLYNINTKNIDVILSNGNVLSGVVEKEIYDKIKDCNNELLIINLLSPPKKVEQLEIDFEKEVQEIIAPIVHILSTNDNFEIEGDKVYLKGIKSIAIPSSIVAEFIRLQENLGTVKVDNSNLEKITLYEEEFNALLMFTFWLLLNPIESSREDCLAFIKKNAITLTSNGLMKCYRRVVSKGSENKELVKFISDSYTKLKKWKKSPKNYFVFHNSEAETYDISLTKSSHPWKEIGNLAELYSKLGELEENLFTDAHTQSKTIKIGEIYREDEDKIDLDNKKDCSSGLHVGSKAFGFSSFGDTGVLALVNPMFVRSVPVSDAHKMRVSEMFIVSTMEKDDYDALDTIIDFSQEYCSSTLEDLHKDLSNKSFEKLTCQDNTPIVSVEEIIDITKVLNERIVKV